MEMLMDRQTDKKRTNKQTELQADKAFFSYSPEMEMLMDKRTKNGQTQLHQFRKEPSYDGGLSPCQV